MLVRVETAGLRLFALRHLPSDLSLNLDAGLVVSFSC